MDTDASLAQEQPPPQHQQGKKKRTKADEEAEAEDAGGGAAAVLSPFPSALTDDYKLSMKCGALQAGHRLLVRVSTHTRTHIP